MNDLRSYVRLVLEEKQRQTVKSRDETEEDNLLLEPDDAEKDDLEENPLAAISTILSIASMAKSFTS